MKRPAFATSVVVAGLVGSLLTSSASLVAIQLDVREFVSQVWFEGMPYEEGNRYDASVVPTLLQLLADPTAEEQRANVVVLLGIIGDERAAEPMINFISQGTAELSMTQYRARSSAIMSLGSLIAKSQNERALSYLIDSMSPQSWQEREIAWNSPFAASMEERDLQLSKMAILGLALSGHPTAGEALRPLQDPPETAADAAFQAEVSDIVSEALAVHSIVAADGLAAYYARQRRP